jgi:hypothetical protein
VGREQAQQLAGVVLDGGSALRDDAEGADAALHAVGEARSALAVTRRDREVPARLGLALGKAPAVVHRRQHGELVGVELEEMRDDALHGRRRVERGLRVAALELVEDRARVLDGDVVGCHEHRDEGQARAGEDDVAIHLRVGSISR